MTPDSPAAPVVAPSPRILRPSGASWPTDSDLQAAARAFHEDGQRLILPNRLREWQVPLNEVDALLSGAPPRHLTPALRWVQQFGTARAQWALVLWGGFSVGKTYASLRWLLEAAKVPIQTLELGRTFRYATSARFIAFSELAAAAGSYREHHQALVAEAIAARALVLDHVDDQTRSAAPILDRVISERHRHQRPTLITTNLGRNLFARQDHYGLRVVLRLEEGGAFRGCGGDDERAALRAALEAA